MQKAALATRRKGERREELAKLAACLPSMCASSLPSTGTFLPGVCAGSLGMGAWQSDLDSQIRLWVQLRIVLGILFHDQTRTQEDCDPIPQRCPADIKKG